MRRVIYDVAISADGFIAGPGARLQDFVHDGAHVSAYGARLASYGTVIMGPRTYEAGYGFGMQPGDKPYPHMDHHVFSRTLLLPEGCGVEIVRDDWLGEVDRLKARPGGDIYLCGGGAFAGHLLAAGRIDRLVLKVNPFIAGGGTPLFGGIESPQPLRPAGVIAHANGVTLLTFEIDGTNRAHPNTPR